MSRLTWTRQDLRSAKHSEKSINRGMPSSACCMNAEPRPTLPWTSRPQPGSNWRFHQALANTARAFSFGLGTKPVNSFHWIHSRFRPLQYQQASAGCPTSMSHEIISRRGCAARATEPRATCTGGTPARIPNLPRIQDLWATVRDCRERLVMLASEHREAERCQTSGACPKIRRPRRRQGEEVEQAEIDRLCRALRQRPRPHWRVLWRARPLQLQDSARSLRPWSRRRAELQAGWELLWTHRLRRDLAPIYRLISCRRGRHRDAHILADDLLGSDDYPRLAICEVCGRAVRWPNGTLVSCA